MDRPLHKGARNGELENRLFAGPWKRRNAMKKSWKKPAMCQVAAGFEISRYLPAEITPKK
jgi:hypothetical protein